MERETGDAGDDPATRYMTGEPVTENVEPGDRPTSELAHDPPTEVLPVVGDGAVHDGATTLSPADPRPDRGRSATVLIGSGAVVAAVAVIAALVFWPDKQGISNATPALPPVPTSAAPPPPTTTEQSSTTESEPSTDERTTERPPETGAPPPPAPTEPTTPQDPTTPQVPTTTATDDPPTTTTTTSATPVPLPRPQ